MTDLGATPANTWRVAAHHVDLRRPRRPARPASVTAMPQNLTLDLAHTAMTLIDMQNDFCTRGGWLDQIAVDVRPTRRAVAGLTTLLPVLHTAEVPVLWVNWGNRTDRLNLSPALLHVYKPTALGGTTGAAA
jgi:hypothetical protein